MDPGSDFIVSYFLSRMYGGYPKVGKYLGSVRCRICMHRQNLINAPGALAPLCSKRYKQRESQYGHSVQSTILTTWLAGRMSVCLSVQHSSQCSEGWWAGGAAGLAGVWHTHTAQIYRQTASYLISTAEGNATQSWLSLSYLYQQKSANKLTLSKSIIFWWFFFSDLVGCGWRSFN